MKNESEKWLLRHKLNRLKHELFGLHSIPMITDAIYGLTSEGINNSEKMRHNIILFSPDDVTKYFSFKTMTMQLKYVHLYQISMGDTNMKTIELSGDS